MNMSRMHTHLTKKQILLFETKENNHTAAPTRASYFDAPSGCSVPLGLSMSAVMSPLARFFLLLSMLGVVVSIGMRSYSMYVFEELSCRAAAKRPAVVLRLQPPLRKRCSVRVHTISGHTESGHDQRREGTTAESCGVAVCVQFVIIIFPAKTEQLMLM